MRKSFTSGMSWKQTRGTLESYDREVEWCGWTQ